MELLRLAEKAVMPVLAQKKAASFRSLRTCRHAIRTSFTRMSTSFTRIL
jgi:hypothetical protein